MERKFIFNWNYSLCQFLLLLSMANLLIISILPKRVTVVCNKIKVVTLKLHKPSACFAFIKKVMSNELTPKL